MNEIIAHWLLIGSDFEFQWWENYECVNFIFLLFTVFVCIIHNRQGSVNGKGKLIEINWTWNMALHTTSHDHSISITTNSKKVEQIITRRSDFISINLIQMCVFDVFTNWSIDFIRVSKPHSKPRQLRWRLFCLCKVFYIFREMRNGWNGNREKKLTCLAKFRVSQSNERRKIDEQRTNLVVSRVEHLLNQLLNLTKIVSLIKTV